MFAKEFGHCCKFMHDSANKNNVQFQIVWPLENVSGSLLNNNRPWMIEEGKK